MGKIFAILGDIHSNIEALSAVLDDCAANGVTDYFCTGDIVGYNASPRECLDKIRELSCPAVMGNHDHYVSSRQDLSDFNPAAAAVVEWTRGQLKMEDIFYLRNLPFMGLGVGFSVVHSTCDNPEAFGYVFDVFQAAANFVKQKTPICFHGHSHCPVVYERRLDGVYVLDPVDMTLVPGRKYFINVGSVGQPRDGDPRASYVIYDQAAKTIRFRRVEYDIAAAQSKVRQAGLPERLAQRLEEGH